MSPTGQISDLLSGDECSVERLVLKLRFLDGRQDPNARLLFSYKQIGDLTGLGVSQVRRICVGCAKSQLGARAKESRLPMSTEVEDFITSSITLSAWSGLMLAQRCVMVHRQFPDFRLSVSRLRAIYIRHGIKRKAISLRKQLPPHLKSKIPALTAEMVRQIQESSLMGETILFLDEVMFTNQTVQKLDYSARGENIVNFDKQRCVQSLAVVASVSSQDGEAIFYIHERSIDVHKFIDFVSGLGDYYKQTRLALVLDNLPVHHSKRVKATCSQLGVRLIFTPPYSPEINPIENVFSLIKREFKRSKLQSLAEGRRIDHQRMIREAFAKVERGVIAKLCLKKMISLGINLRQAL